MGWYGHSNTGACCCHHVSRCLLTVDDFDRADDTDIGSDWTEEAGNAAISGNALLVDTDNSQIIATQSNTDGPNTEITVSLTLGSSSATARVFLGWASTTSYLYATVSATAITVGGTTGGSTTKATTIVPGTVYQLVLCLNGAVLVGRINGVEARKDSLSAPGTEHGLGTGTASVTFDNFVARRVSEPCAECTSSVTVGPCTHCEENQVALRWALDISGVGNGTCTDCTDLNGQWNSGIIGSAGTCRSAPSSAFEGIPLTCGASNEWGFQAAGNLNPFGVPSYYTELEMRINFGGISPVFMTFQTIWGASKVDCDGALDGATIPQTVNNGQCTGGVLVVSVA